MFIFGLIPLEKVSNPFILLAMAWIVSLLFFYKDSFGIE